MTVQSRYQDREQKQDQQQSNSNNDIICHSSTSVWLSGSKQRPTIYLPNDLARKFKMNEPCKISVTDTGDGILLKFLHPIVKHKSLLEEEL
jgi:hypothetical protein